MNVQEIINTQHFFPNLVNYRFNLIKVFASDFNNNGRIDAIWLDTRNDATGGYISELYYSFSVDAGVTWSANVALTPGFDPHVGWPQQNKMGDYFDMVSDDLGANLAYAATFNGAVAGGDVDVRARMFAAFESVIEDPATGILLDGDHVAELEAGAGFGVPVFLERLIAARRAEFDVRSKPSASSLPA